MAMNHTYKKVRGATLIESLTALTLVSVVMGSAFTLYEKTVSSEKQLLRTRAKCLQMAAENMLTHAETIGELSNDLITVNVEEENYSAHVKRITCTYATKQGKIIMKKNYLRYQP